MNANGSHHSILSRLEVIEERIKQVEECQDRLKRHIDALEERLDTVRSGTQYLDDRVDSIFRKLRRLHEFTTALQNLYHTYKNI